MRTRHEVAETRQPVEQAVLAMRVQLDKVLGDGPGPRVSRSRKRGGGLVESSWAGSGEEPHLGCRCSFERSWTEARDDGSETGRSPIHRDLVSPGDRPGRNINGPNRLHLQLHRRAIRVGTRLGAVLHVRAALRPGTPSFDAGRGIGQRADLSGGRAGGGPRVRQGGGAFLTLTTTAPGCPAPRAIPPCGLSPLSPIPPM